MYIWEEWPEFFHRFDELRIQIERKNAFLARLDAAIIAIPNSSPEPVPGIGGLQQAPRADDR